MAAEEQLRDLAEAALTDHLEEALPHRLARVLSDSVIDMILDPTNRQVLYDALAEHSQDFTPSCGGCRACDIEVRMALPPMAPRRVGVRVHHCRHCGSAECVHALNHHNPCPEYPHD